MTNNKACVTIDKDVSNNAFMRVYKPTTANIIIDACNCITIIVNDSCVFTLVEAKNLTIDQRTRQVK